MKQVFGWIALIIIGFALEDYLSERGQLYLVFMFPFLYFIYVWSKENSKIEAKIDSIEKTIDRIYSEIEDIKGNNSEDRIDDIEDTIDKISSEIIDIKSDIRLLNRLNDIRS